MSRRTTKVGSVHADATITLTVRVGQGCKREGVPFTFREMPSIDYSNAPKDVAIKGNQIAVVTRAIADSDPKWSGETSKQEWDRLVRFMGAGYQRYVVDINVTWQTPGVAATNDVLEGDFVGDGGLTSKAGDAAMVKLGSGLNIVKYQGLDPFDNGRNGIGD